MTFERIAVVGAGAWGTALANTIARAGRTVTLIVRDQTSVDAIKTTGESPRLPGIRIESNVTVASALGDHDAVLLGVPSQHVREAARAIAPALASGVPVIACAKGIERGSHRFMTEVIAELAPAARPAILSGPSFAVDVARGLP